MQEELQHMRTQYVQREMAEEKWKVGYQNISGQVRIDQFHISNMGGESDGRFVLVANENVMTRVNIVYTLFLMFRCGLALLLILD